MEKKYLEAGGSLLGIFVFCIVGYCIVLYCIVLYCIVLYCIVLYCIVLYCIVLYCIVLYCIVLYAILNSPIFPVGNSAQAILHKVFMALVSIEMNNPEIIFQIYNTKEKKQEKVINKLLRVCFLVTAQQTIFL